MTEKETISIGSHITVIQNTQRPDDRSWCGAVLLVVAYDWPFYAVRELQFGHKPRDPFPLDARRYEFKVLTPEYVSAMSKE